MKYYKKLYGAGYDGVKQTPSNNIKISTPTVFMLRRLIFATSVVFFQTNWTIQLYLQMYTTLGKMVFFVISNPMADRNVNNIETFNECMFLLLIYLTLTFTDFTETKEDQLVIGWFFIAIFSFTVLFHVFYLFKDFF